MDRPATPVFGEPGRLSYEELRLAARNHGMPLEALGYPITPTGLHYLLTHYDVPAVDTATWTLEVGGAVARPLRLTLADLGARPKQGVVVTMECAGNGRALLEPRPLSQPWLYEAVGTAEWAGVPLAALLDEAGVSNDAVEVVFSALDRGVENGVEQTYERSLALDEARRSEVLVAIEMNGQPLLPQHGAPARLIVPGWYGMTNVKWLSAITVVREPFTGYQQSWSYRTRQDPSEVGVPLSRIAPHALMLPPGIPDFFTRDRVLDCRSVPVDRPRLVGRRPGRWRRGVGRRRGQLGGRDARARRISGRGRGGRGRSTGRRRGPVSMSWPAAPGRPEAPERPEWNLGGYANPAPHRST